MDDITKLILAKYQVENIIELIKDNEYRQYMFMHLNPVFYELDRQLTNLTIADKIKPTQTEEWNHFTSLITGCRFHNLNMVEW